ncbi:MAG: H4MPT-linked C1 transfer pathway protein [Thaumarchaeota archaeon]|nr:H4MPT-linked C1 transfer pathway protein [Nitrososphaerota archaeon]MCL5318705.1 H4MPT-linked C1 transfer pathway protein [Nitrososphaerota archaeon]
MRILGLDVGGANLKIAWVEVLKGSIVNCQTAVEYLPMWRGGKDRLPATLREVSDALSQGELPDAIGVTMTAELSDVFESKREGVEYTLQCVRQIYNGIDPILVVDYNGELGTIKAAQQNPLRYSSANWAATAKVLSGIFADCLLIDIGSTTTDIIPILNHRIATEGRTDMDRLATGELVYTGALRSDIQSITHVLPVNGRETEVAAERFALSGDVHLILGNIAPEEYSTETADGRDTSRQRCFARLARTVCAEPEMIGETGLIKMVSYIYDKQVDKIHKRLTNVLRRLNITPREDMPVVTTGLGGLFLGREAAYKSGFRRFYRLEQIVGGENPQAAAAVSVALLTAAEMGEIVKWSPS